MEKKKLNWIKTNIFLFFLKAKGKRNSANKNESVVEVEIHSKPESDVETDPLDIDESHQTAGSSGRAAAVTNPTDIDAIEFISTEFVEIPNPASDDFEDFSPVGSEIEDDESLDSTNEENVEDADKLEKGLEKLENQNENESEWV